MQIPADTKLLEAARQIAPVIQEHNAEAERQRDQATPSPHGGSVPPFKGGGAMRSWPRW